MIIGKEWMGYFLLPESPILFSYTIKFTLYLLSLYGNCLGWSG